MKPFQKLVLRVLPGFPNTRQTIKAYGLGLSSVFSCLETPVKHSHSFLKYYINNLWLGIETEWFAQLKNNWLLSMHLSVIIYRFLFKEDKVCVVYLFTWHDLLNNDGGQPLSRGRVTPGKYCLVTASIISYFQDILCLCFKMSLPTKMTLICMTK